MKNKILIAALLSWSSALICQTITVRSVATARQPSGDTGYTLDGMMMFDNARLKLLEPANFGPLGIYKKSIEIVDSYSTTGSLEGITAQPKDNIFFFGSFNKLDPQMQQFTKAEIDSFYTWSLRGGKAIISAGQFATGGGYDGNILNDRWGFVWKFKNPEVMLPTPAGAVTDIYNGPFGKGSSKEAGSLQGFFEKLPDSISVIATDEIDQPVLVMDCKTLDLISADVDAYTNLSGVTYGPEIKFPPDIFWANTFVFMDKLQPKPLIKKTGALLTLNAVYNNYQWFLDGVAIATNTQSALEPTKPGTYYVEATLNGGCRLRSNIYVDSLSTGGSDTTSLPSGSPTLNPVATTTAECEVFVPAAFSPNGNGMDDAVCVMGPCIKEMLFRIYDRWGEMVFETTQRENCWDGLHKKTYANKAVFAWTLVATLDTGKKINRSGKITLMK